MKVGVIGLGLMGQTHCETLSKSKYIDRIVGCDLSMEAMSRLQEKVAIGGLYTNHKEMLEKEKLDLVLVSTRDSEHFNPIMDSIDAGIKNIICEKPLTTNVEEARIITDYVKKRNVNLMMLFASRFLSAEKALKACFQENLIGKIVYGDVRSDDSIIVPCGLWGDESYKWVSQTSPAHFLMSHTADLLRWYLYPTEVEAVYAISQREILNTSVDLYDAFIFFNNGIKVRLKSEWIKYMDQLVESYISFSGQEGSIIYNRTPYKCNSSLYITSSRKVNDDKIRKYLDRLKTLRLDVNLVSKADGVVSKIVEIGPDGIKDEEWNKALNYLIDGIVENTLTPSSYSSLGPLPIVDDGLEAVKIACAIEESAKKGEKVYLR
ncbi:MAG: hypothetical protein PWP04_6 [Candidatus Atribacteria bacterium]|nr:hypothetical protein [Candidatus Atribacteria bacterium]